MSVSQLTVLHLFQLLEYFGISEALTLEKSISDLM